MPEIDASYHDDRISMEYWWPRLADVDVPTPETVLVPFEKDEDADGFPIIWDTETIVEAMDSFPSDRAFVRTDRKSAPIFREGALIGAPTAEAVDATVIRLLSQTMDADIPFRSLAVREFLNLDTRAECYTAPVAPEVRAFIDEGEVLCTHLRVTADDLDRSVDDPDGLLDDLQTVAEAEDETIREYAARVADEFDEQGWSVDFLRTVDGEWVCTDMALYGLYYHAMDDEDERWMSISHHESGCPNNLAENPPDDLPSNPENARTGRLFELDC